MQERVIDPYFAFQVEITTWRTKRNPNWNEKEL
jgi:hypothetical protein